MRPLPHRAAWSIGPVGRAIRGRHTPTRPETSPPEAWALRVSGDHAEGAGEGSQSQRAGWAAPVPGAKWPDPHLSLAQLCPGPHLSSGQWPILSFRFQPADPRTRGMPAVFVFVSSRRQ